MSIMIKMYKTFQCSSILASMLMFLVGCSSQNVKYTPHPQLYVTIDNNSYNDGFSKQKQPWIVFSDRSYNKINPSKKEDPFTIYKDAAFLTPFVVLKKYNGIYKIAEYKEGLINDGKLPKSKKLKVLGWIPEERLLLWNNSLKNANTGFTPKSVVVVNHPDVIQYPDKYIENDSVIVYSDPDLINKTKHKINIGSFVYIYKYTEDESRVLIGKKESSIADSIQNNIYGWVSKNVLSLWGERSSLKLAKNSANIGIRVRDSLVASPHELSKKTGIESIYPRKNNGKIKFFTNIFDYKKNKIYNVLGNPIYYNRYKEILSNNRKLNVVFVLDVSNNNTLYIPVVKSLLQDLQLNLMNPDYFSSVNFGGVVYKQNDCGVKPLYSSLSTNYRDIEIFLENQIKRMNCRDSNIVQPIDEGLLTASRMLSGLEDETNIIILIGTTADENNQSRSVINAISRVNAKLVYFQTQSKSADSYNDFVLLGEKAVVNSAQNIAERKKEKIVDQNDLLNNNNYNLTGGENGIYSLDFPTQSMTQGFVLFPKKGETMQTKVLKSAINTLLTQVTKDNKKIDSTLTKYFRSEIGVNNTRIAMPYYNLFPLSNQLIPTKVASSLLNNNTAFLVEGQFSGGQQNSMPQNQTKQGILLNEREYEQIHSLYSSVYKAVFTEKEFNKRKVIQAYLKVVSNHIPTLERKNLKKVTMSELTKIITGFSLSENTLMNMTPKEWIKSKKIELKSVMGYFKQFKDIAAKLSVAQGDSAIRIKHNGQVFYWLSEEYIPKLKQVDLK